MTAKLSLSLALVLVLTGCRSFLAEHVMKTYSVKAKPAEGVTSPNPYQADFLTLKTLGEDVVPLEDHYFPPAKRALMEREILRDLGQPNCTYDTFVWSLHRYLSAFNNEHARIEFNPKPVDYRDLYPFSIHYVSNDVYVADISRQYDRSLIGQKITAINEVPISEVEQKLFGYVGAESVWMRRTSLEPFGYSEPEMYRLTGLASSISNSVKLDFSGHPSVWLAPALKRNLQWHSDPRHPDVITQESSHKYDCRIFTNQNFAYLQFNACFDKTAILDGLIMVNPWIRPAVRTWLALEFHRKKPTLVLRDIYDPERPILKDYLTSTIRDVNRQGITNLIIDLRYNGGGESELIKQFLYFLTPRTNLIDSKEYVYNPKVLAFYDPAASREIRAWYKKKFAVEPPFGQLLKTPYMEQPFFSNETDRASVYYVASNRPVFNGRIVALVNQNTHSAASLLAGLMQDNGLAEIVGTTSGNNPTGPTGMTPFKLPHSGILVSLPTDYEERAMPSKGDILIPDYWVENSTTDNKAERDAPFEKALELLNLKDAISIERISVAGEFLRSLKKNGQLPGWQKNDTGSIVLETYSDSLTFAVQKKTDSSIYHYTVTKPSRDGPWKLEKGWRTDKKGRLLQQYSSL